MSSVEYLIKGLMIKYFQPKDVVLKMFKGKERRFCRYLRIFIPNHSYGCISTSPMVKPVRFIIRYDSPSLWTED